MRCNLGNFETSRVNINGAGRNNELGLLLIPDFVSLANEAFLMGMSHVRVQFVVAKEAVTTKLAEWVYTALDLVSRHAQALLLSTLGGGKMGEVLWRCVQCMFV